MFLMIQLVALLSGQREYFVIAEYTATKPSSEIYNPTPNNWQIIQDGCNEIIKKDDVHWCGIHPPTPAAGRMGTVVYWFWQAPTDDTIGNYVGG